MTSVCPLSLRMPLSMQSGSLVQVFEEGVIQNACSPHSLLAKYPFLLAVSLVAVCMKSQKMLGGSVVGAGSWKADGLVS